MAGQADVLPPQSTEKTWWRFALKRMFDWFWLWDDDSHEPVTYNDSEQGNT